VYNNINDENKNNNIKLTNLTMNNAVIYTAQCDNKTVYHTRLQLDS